MAYHIKQIINNSSKSIAVVNLHSNPDGRDNRIVLPDNNIGVPNPILIQKIELSGTIPYESAANDKVLNVYTVKDNWFVWDNGKSTLLAVGQAAPNQNLTLYKGDGTDLTLTVGSDGSISFGKFVTALK